MADENAVKPPLDDEHRTKRRQRIFHWAAVAALLLILFAQLLAVNLRTSMSWDEGHHLFDGYTILKHHDFALNPEVPPFAKVIAALPVLPMHLYEPAQQGRDSQLEAFTDGREFLFRNDANQLLLRSRLAVSAFTLLLAALVYWAGHKVFDPATGLLALAFLAFDPLLLAHGALVTTDAAIASLVFATVYGWYRYCRHPAAWRIGLIGLVAGLALATKFTGLFLFPVLFPLMLTEAAKRKSVRLALSRTLALIAIACIAYIVLWACYGFRYAARPNGLSQNPPLAAYLETYSRVANPKPLQLLARTHALPEAYIWGLANTRLTEDRNVSYLFGTIRRHGTWLYFPSVIAIKSTLPFLILLAIAAFIGLKQRHLIWRYLVLLVPVAVFLALAMRSDMNIGARHILPIYPFLYLIGAAGISAAIAGNLRWRSIAIALLVFQAVTSLRSFPGYIAYANEAWGGQKNVHRLLSDSNSDWGQQLKTVHAYLQARHVTDCWFAYTASGVADERYYGVPCRPLPTVVNLWWIPVPMNVPQKTDGTVLISDDELEGIDQNFGQPSPYAQFKSLTPTAVLDGGILVYDGHFDMTAAARLVDLAQPKP